MTATLTTTQTATADNDESNDNEADDDNALNDDADNDADMDASLADWPCFFKSAKTPIFDRWDGLNWVGGYEGWQGAAVVMRGDGGDEGMRTHLTKLVFVTAIQIQNSFLFHRRTWTSSFKQSSTGRASSAFQPKKQMGRCRCWDFRCEVSAVSSSRSVCEKETMNQSWCMTDAQLYHEKRMWDSCLRWYSWEQS